MSDYRRWELEDGSWKLEDYETQISQISTNLKLIFLT